MPEDDPFQRLRAKPAAEATRDELLELLSFHEQALLELRDGLMAAAQSRGGKGPAGDRSAAIDALHATVRFLHAHGFRDASRPLVQLESVLSDLDHGRIPAMLAPRVDGDRVSLHLKLFHLQVAGVMGGLMKHASMFRPQAEKWVSKRLKATGHKVTPATVRDWRQEALNYEKNNPELYESYCTFIDMPGWAPAPLSFAESVIARLISVYSQKEE